MLRNQWWNFNGFSRAANATRDMHSIIRLKTSKFDWWYIFFKSFKITFQLFLRVSWQNVHGRSFRKIYPRLDLDEWWCFSVTKGIETVSSVRDYEGWRWEDYKNENGSQYVMVIHSPNTLRLIDHTFLCNTKWNSPEKKKNC